GSQAQYLRNAEDGMGWLSTADAGLDTVTSQLHRARDLATQAASTGSMTDAGRTAIVEELQQIRQSLIGAANSTYVDRPVFGGSTIATAVYNPDGSPVDPGSAAAVMRTVGDGVRVRVNIDAETAF